MKFHNKPKGDRNLQRFIHIMTAFVIGSVLGCQQSPRREQSPLAMPDIIERINSNNRLIPTLWARVNLYAELRMPETGKRRPIYADSGHLLYRAPGDLRLRATKFGAGLLLDMGINEDRYWVFAPDPGPDILWWGHSETQSGPSEVPFRPQDVLEILAVRSIARSGPDAPEFQFSESDDAYVFTWRRKPDDQVSRQVMYDRETLLPKTVVLFDADGRPALHAKLSDFGKVDSQDKSEPLLAREYHIRFPEDQSWAVLRLLDVTVSRKEVPNEGSFRFPDKVPKMKQIDAEASRE